MSKGKGYCKSPHATGSFAKKRDLLVTGKPLNQSPFPLSAVKKNRGFLTIALS